MIEFRCNICNKYYSSKQSLCNHNRKFHTNEKLPSVTASVTTSVTPSVTTSVTNSVPSVTNVTNYYCKYCNKIFKRRQTKWTHENKYCKKQTIVTTEPAVTIINNNTNTNTNNNNGTINNITINNYSNDNIGYISDTFIKRIFKYLKNTAEYHIPIPRVIENIKFNPNHKENNNVKITNIRSKVGMKYDDNKWLTIDKDQLLNELFIKATDLLKKWSEREGFMTNDMKNDYERFNKISKLALKIDIKEELNKKAYIYTKNNEVQLDA